MASFHDEEMNPYRIPQDRRERPELPLEGFPEDSWGDTLKAELGNAVSRWGRGGGALLERMGSGDSLRQQKLMEATRTLQNEGDASESRSVFSRTFNGPISKFLRRQRANMQLKTAALTGDIAPAAAEAIERGDWQAAEQLVGREGVRRGPFASIEDKMAQAGRNMYENFNDEVITNQPNVRPGSLKSAVGNTLEYGLGTLLPAAASAVGMATIRRPPPPALMPQMSTARLWPNAAPPDMPPLPNPTVAQNGAPYPDGTKLRRGGVLYEVVNGEPVPLE